MLLVQSFFSIHPFPIICYLYKNSMCAYEFKRSLVFLTVTYCFKLVFLTSKLELSNWQISKVVLKPHTPWRFSSRGNGTLNPFPGRDLTAWLCTLLSCAYSWISKLNAYDTQVFLTESEKYCNKNYFNKSILHKMIIFVLLYRFCLKGIIFSFGLMSTRDKSIISINTLITDFAKYHQDWANRLWTKGKIHPCAKISVVGLQKGHPFHQF